jgi:hypothetical protein
MQRVTIHGTLPTLNESNNSARTHWAIAAKQKKQATELVELQCKRMKKITEPVVVTLHWFISSKHDPDNIRAGVKYILDGFMNAGKLPNDNQKWIIGFGGDYFIKVPKGQEKIIVELEEYEEEKPSRRVENNKA